MVRSRPAARAVPVSRSRRAGSLRRGAAVAVAGLLSAGCSGLGPDHPEIGPPDAPPGPTSAPPTTGVTGTVSVLAAPLLTEALTELADRFEQANPGAHVVTTFTTASQIVGQVSQPGAGGSPDAVFLDDRSVLDPLVTGGTLDPPVDLATAAPEIAVRAGNPQAITGVSDLARLSVALCEPSAPCGRLADEVLRAAGVTLSGALRDGDVKAAIGRVTAGAADAAIVYHPDVLASDADGVAITGSTGVTVVGAVVSASPERGAAQALLDYLRSTEGRQILSDFGFTPAP